MVKREKTIGVLMDFLVPGVIDGAGAYAREHGLRIDARWSVRADWVAGRAWVGRGNGPSDRQQGGVETGQVTGSADGASGWLVGGIGAAGGWRADRQTDRADRADQAGAS